MNWLKLTQRLLAVIAIFLIWIAVYRLTMNASKIHGLESVELPKETLGLIQINTPQLSKAFLFESAFNNRDPRVLKIVSEYWQNLAQDSSSKQLPIDFQDGITLLKVKHGSEIVWMISGKHIQVHDFVTKLKRFCFFYIFLDDGKLELSWLDKLKLSWRKATQVDQYLEPELGFVKNNRYYWILNSSIENCSKIKDHLLKTPWYTFTSKQSNSIQYHLISRGKVTNSYQFESNDQQLNIRFKPSVKVASVTPKNNQKYFQVTSSLNKGSFIPKKYLDYQKIIESLSGFSMNYYGAKYIDDDSGPSYLEPQFDMYLTFAKKTKPSDVFPLLKELMGDNLILSDQRLWYHGSKYYVNSLNDSTLYIGKNKMEAQVNSNTFSMNGSLEVITEISNLGWKAGILELIPEYRALKEFSHSIRSISTHGGGGDHTLSVQFKPGVNAQLESFLLVLTLVNAYQF